MKHLRQLSAGLLAAVMLLSCTACGKTEESTGLANPVVEVTQTELAQNTGIDLAAPDGAENVSYAYISGSADQGTIAQVQFTLDGVEYCYRAQSTGITSLFGEQSADAVTDTTNALETGKTLSGLNDDFKNGATVTINDRDGFCAFTEKKSGFVVWLDVVPGILYTLSTSKGATEDALVATAEKVFVPAQGETDGDADAATTETAENTEAAAAEGETTADVSTFAGTYTRSDDSSTLTINADGTVKVEIERLCSMEGTATGAEKGIAPITVQDPNGNDMGLEFNTETHELIVVNSTWDNLENGTSFQFD